MHAGPMRGSPLRIALFVFLLSVSTAQAAPGVADPEAQRVGTAVALNYCRASFHRIMRYPSKRVLLEEQEKILNNLNLNGIADEEIIRLYTAVLLEISEVQIADKEREVITDTHKRAFRRQLLANVTGIVGKLADGQYTAALKAGCSSWWDYRGMIFQKELDLWKVDKQRMLAVTDKSSLFLDTFWKLASRRTIPDRWLVRNDDLDRLDAALQEPNLEVRLRVLQRMEQFMECYPPYWYYVGRTQQMLGHFGAAAQTFSRLAALGAGHFRKDEMLAAALANLAMIQDHYQQADALETARRALGCATCVWEANVICGRILERHGDVAMAEDALLRNLDVDLEREQTLSALLGLYYRTGNRRELAARLADPNVLRTAPIPVLLQCATTVPEMLPPTFAAYVSSSLSGDFDLRFGPDDFVVHASPDWQLSAAQTILSMGERGHQKASLSTARGTHELRFHAIGDLGNLFNAQASVPALVLSLRYPGLQDIHVHLRPAGAGPLVGASAVGTGSEVAAQPVAFGRQHGYRVWAVSIGNVTLPLDGTAMPAIPELRAPSVSPIPAAPAVPQTLPGPAFPTTPSPGESPSALPGDDPDLIPPLPAVKRRPVRGLPVLSTPEFQ